MHASNRIARLFTPGPRSKVAVAVALALCACDLDSEKVGDEPSASDTLDSESSVAAGDASGGDGSDTTGALTMGTTTASETVDPPPSNTDDSGFGSDSGIGPDACAGEPPVLEYATARARGGDGAPIVVNLANQPLSCANLDDALGCNSWRLELRFEPGYQTPGEIYEVDGVGVDSSIWMEGEPVGGGFCGPSGGGSQVDGPVQILEITDEQVVVQICHWGFPVLTGDPLEGIHVASRCP